ncbi:hypothetical protein ACOSQ2_004428 [Xanthoceras sorbifolium]
MQKSLRSKAIHFVSDLSTVLLDPISDKPSKPPPPPPPLHPYHEDETEPKMGQLDDGPDTSSFTAFLSSFLASSECEHNLNSEEQNGYQEETIDALSNTLMKENGGKKSLFSRGKSSLRAIYQAARISGYRNQVNRVDSEMKIEDEDDTEFDGLEMRNMQNVKEPMASVELPDVFEPSLLHTKKTRSSLYASLPGIVQGRKCISLSTLYKRNFTVKEIELWGFVYGSKYEEILALSKTEMPGISRW